MAEVYIVTSGEYSDYRIDCVFDNRAAADEFVARGPSWPSGRQVEVWELNHEVDRNEPIWQIMVFRETKGGLSKARITDMIWVPEGSTLGVVEHWAPPPWVDRRPSLRQEYWAVYVQSDREAKAHKIGTDLIAQAIAEEAGIA